MTTAATISARLILDSSDFQSGIKTASKVADTFDTKMKTIGGNMQKFGGMMSLGVTLPILAFGKASVDSAMESESALADLNAVLKSTGGIAGVSLDELTKNADALQKITKFSDESIMSAQGMLLTFTNIGKDVFPDATMATLDMAEKFGMDTSQAAITLGKALNDPISGVTALRRIGVMLTDEQEAQIRKFMEVGNVAGAQGIIMAELAKEIGGVAEAAGETNSGKLAQFTNKFDEMREVIGTALIPLLIRIMEAITPLIERFAAMTPAQQNMILGFLAFVAIAGPVIGVIGTIITTVGALMPVITALGAFITATLIPGLGALFVALSPIIIPLLIIIATVALVYLAFKNNFGGIRTTVEQLWFIIKVVFSNITNAISAVIKKVAEMVAAFLKVKLPKMLTPGSPTPFEMGLRGISSAMDSLSGSSLPKLQTGLNIDQNVTSAGGGGAGASAEAKAPSSLTINIENPKKETAEESVRKTLKNLSYLGVPE